MSDHVIVTIAVPAAHIADANQLAKTLGYGSADENTFNVSNWKDDEGNLYAVASGLVSTNFLADAQGELTEPAWGSDLIAAKRAQSFLNIYNPDLNSSSFAVPFEICVVIGVDAQSAIEILGLTQIVEEINGGDG